MAAIPRIRTRTVIPAVGAAFVTAEVRLAPTRGIIRRARATASPAEDGQAVTGGQVTDIGMEVRESATATGMGGVAEAAVLLAYALTPAAVDLTINSAEDAHYTIRQGNVLTVAVRADQAGPSTIVVTLEIEPTDEG